MLIVNGVTITQVIVNGSIDISKVIVGDTNVVFSKAIGIYQGSSSLLNGSWYINDTSYKSYDSNIHISQSFSMPQIRWDGGCSHGTWCDSTPVVSFYYPKEYGADFLKLSSATVACDGCHWGSGLVAARATPGTYGLPSNAVPLIDVQIDYSYFTFARTVYIVPA